MSTVSQDQAAACLRHFFNQLVAEAMPKAIRAQLGNAATLGHWLHDRTLRISASHFGPLDDADLPTLGSLSISTLLVILFDQHQPEAVVLAARNVLLGRYLSDDDVQALAIAEANRMARQSIQDMQAARAEQQALHGTPVPGTRVLDASEC